MQEIHLIRFVPGQSAIFDGVSGFDVVKLLVNVGD
jgi:hypothetical protein